MPDCSHIFHLCRQCTSHATAFLVQLFCNCIPSSTLLQLHSQFNYQHNQPQRTHLRRELLISPRYCPQGLMRWGRGRGQPAQSRAASSSAASSHSLATTNSYNIPDTVNLSSFPGDLTPPAEEEYPFIFSDEEAPSSSSVGVSSAPAPAAQEPVPAVHWSVGVWQRLIRRSLRIRALQRLWHEIGEHLKTFSAEYRLRLRQIWLPPSGVRPTR